MPRNAASSILKSLENSLIVILFLFLTESFKMSEIFQHLLSVNFTVMFLELIKNPRNSVSCFGIRHDFSG